MLTNLRTWQITEHIMNGLVLRYGNRLRDPCTPSLLQLVQVVQLLEFHDILRLDDY